MGGAQKNVTNLDREGLAKYLKDHKLTASKLSLDMGWANNYITECLRDKNPKPMKLSSYKYLCTVLKVPEDSFILKTVTKKEKAEEPKKDTPVVVQSGLTDGQFNALLQAIQSLTDTIQKGFANVASTESSTAIIQGKIYGEVSELAKALGVNKPTPLIDSKPNTSKVHVKAPYVKPSTVGGNQ